MRFEKKDSPSDTEYSEKKDEKRINLQNLQFVQRIFEKFCNGRSFYYKRIELSNCRFYKYYPYKKEYVECIELGEHIKNIAKLGELTSTMKLPFDMETNMTSFIRDEEVDIRYISLKTMITDIQFYYKKNEDIKLVEIDDIDFENLSNDPINRKYNIVIKTKHSSFNLYLFGIINVKKYVELLQSYIGNHVILVSSIIFLHYNNIVMFHHTFINVFFLFIM